MKVFDIDNPVWSTCSRILDIIILNFLFMLSCVPVVTISTSVTALYFTCQRIVSGTLTYVARDFWNSFKRNFKQAFVAGVIVFDAGVILAVGTYLSFASGAYLGKVLFAVLDLIFIAMVSYLFPMLSKFEMSTGKLFHNSLLMVFVHVPFTLLNLGVFMLVGLAVYLSVFARVLLVVCGFVLVGMLQSLWFRHLFQKYMTQEERDLTDTFREEEKQAQTEKKQKQNRARR